MFIATAYAFLFFVCAGIANQPAEAPISPTLFQCEADGGKAYIYCHEKSCTCPDIFFVVGDK